MLESLMSNQPFEYKKLPKEEMESRGILGRLVGIIADFTNPTRNGRLYKEKLWDNVFNDPIMKERIENRCCFGELGHPTDREETDMSKIAICLAEKPVKKDGKLYGVFDILNNANGQILKTLCDYGCNIGVSSRGSGDLEMDFDGTESVNPDSYTCEGWDAVLIPAVKEARLQYVTESLNKTRYNKTLKDKLSESISKETADNQKSMKESLNALGIDLNESQYKGYDVQNAADKTIIRDGNGNIITTVPTDDEATEWIDEHTNDLTEDYVPDFFDSINDTDLSAIDDIIPIEEINDETLNDDIDAKININEIDDKEDDENIEAEDDGSIYEELQKSFALNKKLDEKILSLKESLSVSYAKEMELEEQLDEYKSRIENLSKQSNQIKDLTEQLNKLTESNQALTHMNESVNASRKKLTESLTNKTNMVKELSETIKTHENTITNLNEKVNSINESYKSEINDRDNRIAELEKDLKQLKESYTDKLKTQKGLVEKYQNIAIKSVNKYIDTQAIKLGISSNEIKNRLPESYSFKDIDRICEDLQEYKVNINNLPFATKGKLNENFRIAVNNLDKRTLVNNADDEIDDLTARLAGQIR